jgi:hypothetical protein
MQDDMRIDVVVRFHSPARLRELDRCLFSLFSQSHRPLQVHLAVQRFSAEEVSLVQEKLAPLLQLQPPIGIEILNWQEDEPPDARSVLINFGVEAAQGRYLAFLDYDDVLYPEAYDMLIEKLRATGAAIAFGGICVKEIAISEVCDYTCQKRFPFSGDSLVDLFRDNFCPIHSFVIDRSRVSRQDLFFEPAMTRAEDYDFLIRLCAKYPSDFSMVKTIIGDYYYKDDGSNSILTQSSRALDTEAFLEGRRRITLVSSSVQRSLGLDPDPELTVRQLVDNLS